MLKSASDFFKKITGKISTTQEGTVLKDSEQVVHHFSPYRGIVESEIAESDSKKVYYRWNNKDENIKCESIEGFFQTLDNNRSPQSMLNDEHSLYLKVADKIIAHNRYRHFGGPIWVSSEYFNERNLNTKDEDDKKDKDDKKVLDKIFDNLEKALQPIHHKFERKYVIVFSEGDISQAEGSEEIKSLRFACKKDAVAAIPIIKFLNQGKHWHLVDVIQVMIDIDSVTRKYPEGKQTSLVPLFIKELEALGKMALQDEKAFIVNRLLPGIVNNINRSEFGDEEQEGTTYSQFRKIMIKLPKLYESDLINELRKESAMKVVEGSTSLSLDAIENMTSNIKRIQP